MHPEENYGTRRGFDFDVRFVSRINVEIFFLHINISFVSRLNVFLCGNI